MTESTGKFNPHHNVTADGVEITPDLIVWDYDMKVGTVVKDHDSTTYKCCLGVHPVAGGEKPGQARYNGEWMRSGENHGCDMYCDHDHWFDVKRPDGSTSMMNGERMAVSMRGINAAQELARLSELES